MITVFYPFINSFGGIERLLVDLHQECCSRGVETRLLCFDNRVDFSAYGAADLNVTVLSGPRHLVSETLRLRRFCQAHPSEKLLVMEMCGVIYCSMLTIPYCLHIADTPALLPRDISKHAWTYPLRSSSQVPTAGWKKRAKGELVYRMIRRGISMAQSRLTMTARNSAELQQVFGLPFEFSWPGIAQSSLPLSPQPEWCSFLSVCRLEPSKRVDWIIQSFSEIPLELRCRARLDIVGDGSSRSDLESLAVSLGVADAVHFHGHVSDAVLEQCYRDGSVFVMPARQGYGLPGLEALLRGLRLVVHSESGVSEALEGCERAAIISDRPTLTVALQHCCRTHAATPRVSMNPRPRSVWVDELLHLFNWHE